MDHIRPYYRMQATTCKTPTEHCSSWDWRQIAFLLAGASNLGLAERGRCASLTQATTSFVTLKSSRLLVYLCVLDSLHDETGEAFIKADEAAKQIAEDKRQKATDS